jgi:hypothetical protein
VDVKVWKSIKDLQDYDEYRKTSSAVIPGIF